MNLVTMLFVLAAAALKFGPLCRGRLIGAAPELGVLAIAALPVGPKSRSDVISAAGELGGRATAQVVRAVGRVVFIRAAALR